MKRRTEIASITQHDIESGLRDINIEPGHIVMVHSSLSSFGHVEGGAGAVIDALMSAVGTTGTLIMPTFTLSYRNTPAPILDLRHSPSEVGAITEVFRTRPGVVRTRHILHSVACWGERAVQVAACRHVTSWGADTPFIKLYDWDGWIVLLGCSYTSCTLLHAVEQAAGVPYRYVQEFPDARLIDEDGRESALYCTTLTRKEGYDNDFSKPGTLLAERGVESTATVGGATIRAVRARDLIDLVWEAVRSDPGYLLREGSNRV